MVSPKEAVSAFRTAAAACNVHGKELSELMSFVFSASEEFRSAMLMLGADKVATVQFVRSVYQGTTASAGASGSAALGAYLQRVVRMSPPSQVEASQEQRAADGALVLNWRPDAETAAGEVPELIHPTFARVLYVLKGDGPIDKESLYSAAKLCEKAAVYYGNEAMLNENVMEVLEEYLQPWASIKGGFVPGSKISPNGAVGDKPKNPTNVYVIYEGKLNSADALYQGAIYFLKFWASRSGDARFKNTYCPAFLLEVMGTQIRLSSLAWLARVTVFPLTPFFNLLPVHPYSRRLVVPVARLLMALRAGVMELADPNAVQVPPLSLNAKATDLPLPWPIALSPRYKPLTAKHLAGNTFLVERADSGGVAAEGGGAAAESGGAAAGDGAAAEGGIAAVGGGQQSGSKGQSGGGLAGGGGRRGRRGGGGRPGGKAAAAGVGAAAAGGGAAAGVGSPSMVVVKLCPDGYGTEVQQAWADAQLAPEVLHVEELPGQWHLVEMEYLPKEEWIPLEHVPAVDREQALSAAVERLEYVHRKTADQHGAALVHGDARPPNCLVRRSKEGGWDVRFVDFEWSGRAGKATYPGFLNNQIPWPGGVDYLKPLLPEHDVQLLQASAVTIINGNNNKMPRAVVRAFRGSRPPCGPSPGASRAPLLRLPGATLRRTLGWRRCPPGWLGRMAG